MRNLYKFNFSAYFKEFNLIEFESVKFEFCSIEAPIRILDSYITVPLKTKILEQFDEVKFHEVMLDGVF